MKAPAHNIKAILLLQIITAILLLLLIDCRIITAQPLSGKADKQLRALHYKPVGTDFILHKGQRKFNRALYGTHTGFRVKAGDLPEFALYLPGMGGNCKIGIKRNDKSKWVTEADKIKTIYRPGTMLYEIKDELLLQGTLHITVLAMAATEGMVIKITTVNTPADLEIVMLYGGVTGTKFKRDGDIGADPESSFYLLPEYCRNNIYKIKKNSFQLLYGFNKIISAEQYNAIESAEKADTSFIEKSKILSGVFPANAVIKIADAAMQQTPGNLWASSAATTKPVIAATVKATTNSTFYWNITVAATPQNYNNLPGTFAAAEKTRRQIADRITVNTPDAYINTIGGALAVAADAIWKHPTFMHGAVAWRMRLPAWRGAYAADALGWHDRARSHFESYLLSQVTQIPPGAIVADTALHIARQQEKMGTALFSNGYICRNPNGDIRPHHYDMNLVFIDQLLNHIYYTGDLVFARKIWPALQLHLQWEKRNFDADNDGLYDAYACIWASDALQYSGGGVAHSSAYNYRANITAAYLAGLLGEDATVYQSEANKIKTAVSQKLWLSHKGWLAEYIDATKYKWVHPNAGLWTVYHAMDAADLLNPFQKYLLTRYVDTQIPHIPITTNEESFKNAFLLTTTNWQPYTWSVNNVVLAENLHTALAYWQAGNNNAAFHLWKSAIAESMYMSASPGGFQQLSFYDAVRGELYRDFADPVGMAARTLTEGLFGIMPQATSGKLVIQPGFPHEWDFASLHTPDIRLDFKATTPNSVYSIQQSYNKLLNINLYCKAIKDSVIAVTANGKPVKYYWQKNAVGQPVLIVDAGNEKNTEIKIQWGGRPLVIDPENISFVENETLQFSVPATTAQQVYDPQNVFTNTAMNNSLISGKIQAPPGSYTVFIECKQGNAVWWQPVHITVKPPLTISSGTEKEQELNVLVTNNHTTLMNGKVLLNGFEKAISLKPEEKTTIKVPARYAVKGTNQVSVLMNDTTTITTPLINWQLAANNDGYKPVDISAYYNANNADIFKQQYMAPRANSVTLQIPWQGIGNWCYPLIQPEIADAAQLKMNKVMMDGVPFTLSAQHKNISYTSLWNNYPDSVKIALSGNATHAYFLLAGSTNHQQFDVTNALITVTYTDGSIQELPLTNPYNWLPVEQELRNDGLAFNTGVPPPYRFYFADGRFSRSNNNFTDIRGFTDRGIAGGAGFVADMPLDRKKTLQSIQLKTMAGEVVAGIMAITLLR